MRRHISKEVREVALRIFQHYGLPEKLVSDYTGISTKSLESLRHTYCKTSEVIRTLTDRTHLGSKIYSVRSGGLRRLRVWIGK
jgi:hypothetical protein